MLNYLSRDIDIFQYHGSLYTILISSPFSNRSRAIAAFPESCHCFKLINALRVFMPCLFVFVTMVIRSITPSCIRSSVFLIWDSVTDPSTLGIQKFIVVSVYSIDVEYLISILFSFRATNYYSYTSYESTRFGKYS